MNAGLSVEELEARSKQERERREKDALRTKREQERVPLPEAAGTAAHATKTAADAKPASAAPSREEGPNGVKPLDAIVKLEMLMDKDAETIGKIWNQHHASKPGRLSALVPAETYRQMARRAREFPSFILPLPREQGAEFFWLQFSGHQCYFTSLAEYKLHGEQARPYLVLTHYPELIESKQIVLMRGELGDADGAKEGQSTLMTSEDARLLVYLLQDFYVTGSEAKQKLVEQFHREPATFKFEELMDAVNRLG
ncbi:ATP11 protein-domain-containing protein [Syncephalis pseudoplumigaleata]|uniref:ATP11 protein-domain-containing protein n=1 Tax=Syncephalis pseudoplumigaleata TaxID=1712513 RepID=A0A4P9Z5C9_9FUNG|nr:ATP11 protein-domain-containing protein [Syncephalis pseudoplumigaleata]|eukprot:RKP27834.1 ATP11 protein-domain-containing protein [Syncephalis pseudoplumigaleata]